METRYYCSKPRIFHDKFMDALMVIASVQEYDTNGSLDCSEQTYLDLLETVENFMIEIEENIFEPYDSKLDAASLEFKMKGLGFIYNTKLDSKLEIWIKEKEDEVNKAVYAKGRSWQPKEKSKEHQ